MFCERKRAVEKTKKNFICSLYPTTKLIACLSFVILAFLLPTFVERLFLLAIIHILAIVSGTYKNFIKISFLSVGILTLFVLFIQSLFYQGESTRILMELGIFSVKYEGFIHGLNLASSILVFGGAILLFFQTTTIKDFIYSLEVSGLNSKASYVILATLQMIPQMHKNSQVIMSAQKSRGVETEGNLIVRAKAFLPILAPLILSSIANTEEKALTLEARGFSAPVKKTQLMILHKEKRDSVLVGFFLVLTVCTIVWRVASWVI
nr:energy-coupling factor transporter transmembrane component T [Lederbergia citrea]